MPWGAANKTVTVHIEPDGGDLPMITEYIERADDLARSVRSALNREGTTRGEVRVALEAYEATREQASPPS